MKYLMSDLHGCYELYMKMLEKIHFSESDELYILGDVVDRGELSIKLLKDMMSRPNVYPILGNHEYAMYTAMSKLLIPITEDTVSAFDSDNLQEINHWIADGGDKTLEESKQYTKEELQEILDYINEEFALYEHITVGRNKYVLVHAGLRNFSPERPLESYKLHELIFEPADINQEYFIRNTFLVTGHTPTFLIDSNSVGVIMKNKNNIALDCGCVFSEVGGKLGCLCLDTMEEFYV